MQLTSTEVGFSPGPVTPMEPADVYVSQPPTPVPGRASLPGHGVRQTGVFMPLLGRGAEPLSLQRFLHDEGRAFVAQIQKPGFCVRACRCVRACVRVPALVHVCALPHCWALAPQGSSHDQSGGSCWPDPEPLSPHCPRGCRTLLWSLSSERQPLTLVDQASQPAECCAPALLSEPAPSVEKTQYLGPGPLLSHPYLSCVLDKSLASPNMCPHL